MATSNGLGDEGLPGPVWERQGHRTREYKQANQWMATDGVGVGAGSEGGAPHKSQKLPIGHPLAPFDGATGGADGPTAGGWRN
jgi:hypothetical protein